jgi:flavodoxin I
MSFRLLYFYILGGVKMTKIILVFASMSGNTEMMAEAVAKGIREAGGEVTVVDIMEGPEATDLESYDGIVLGAYTWGDGDLPDDFLDFYDDMDSINLSGKKAAVFGSCDSAYQKYGAAVDILVEKLLERGAELYSQGLKMELTPDEEDQDECRTFGKSFATFVNR